MHARGIFVCATDTGVGKTWLGAGIAAWFRKNGFRVGVYKPFVSGDRKKIPSDVAHLRRGAGLPAASAHESYAVRYRRPLAPWPASWLEGGFSWRIVEQKKQKLMKKYEVLVVEGIGGLLVPLDGHRTVLDLIGLFRLPVLIVARPGLGTLNHTLMTYRILKNAHVKIFGVLLNGARGARRDPSEKTNALVLRRLLGVPVFGPLPWNPAYRRPEILAAWLEKETFFSRRAGELVGGTTAERRKK